jgi:phenylpyruvate tautomerase PptA (4-oxalocrotonate tautomerase family)
MPFIRVNYPKGALSAEQKAALAPKLVHALIRQEIDPVTESGTAKTGMFFNELDVQNCFPGGVPLADHPEKIFWTVEAFVAASYFSQPRRDQMQRDVAQAFVEAIGDDGTVMQRGDIRISPSYLMQLHVVFVEIPEGSWGAGGQTIDTEMIGVLLGATEGPVRFGEALELGKRMREARLS